MSGAWARRILAAVGLASFSVFAIGASDPAPADRTTYSIEYVVRISADRPSVARVRWNLAGIDEVRRLRIELDGERFRDFEASGQLEKRERDVIWRPSGPYAHLEYQVRLRHRRAEEKGYDSYGTKNWVLTRAQDLFPKTHITFELDVEREPRSRATVRFFLPSGWQSYTAMDRIAGDTFRPFVSGARLDRPKGWIALGRLERVEREIAGVQVTIVAPPGTSFPAKATLDLYESTLPILTDILRARIPALLIVSAPDPMWHGGLSGERSIYLHADRPIRTPDETSPALHEAFHVLAPFLPDKDSRWLTEGLAEYYSLLLQRRVGVLDDARYRHGLRSWKEYAQWGVNLTTGKDLGVTNNAAPFVLAAIDERVQRETASKHNLDDVVREIAKSGERRLTTASFLRAVKRVTGADATPFVQRHVYAGAPPKLAAIETPHDAAPARP